MFLDMIAGPTLEDIKEPLIITGIVTCVIIVLIVLIIFMRKKKK